MSCHANNMLDDLINTLKHLVETKNPLILVVKNYSLLIEGLLELKNMIEMDKIKVSIVEQVKLLITNKSRNADDSHMLHCVISGEPSQGKTSVARILAKIWLSLDIIKTPTKKNYIGSLEKAVIEYDYKLNKINKGLDIQLQIIQELKNKNDKSLIKSLKKNVNRLMDIYDHKIEEIDVKTTPPFIVATREMMVGSYVGTTSPKTKAVLESALGGVLFIDEAYSLYTSDRDLFGMECLNVINEFMSLRSGEIIVVFAGYKELLMNTIFHAQKGLYRRCMWFFEIEKYSLSALSKIFKRQLEQHEWTLDPLVDVEKILTKNKILKTPGDTDKLVYQCKLAYAEYHFDNVLENGLHQSVINHDMIMKGIEKMIRNNPKVDDKVPCHMYT